MIAVLVGGVYLLAAAMSPSAPKQPLEDPPAPAGAANSNAALSDRTVEEPLWLSAHLGKPAPDVELPRLALGDAQAADASAPRVGETFRISSLRGKKIVCLFLSSFS